MVLHPEYERVFHEEMRDRATFKLRALDFNVDAQLRALGGDI